MEEMNEMKDVEKIETQITLDDLDVIGSLLDGIVESMDKDDEDKKSLEALAEKIADFTDKVCSLSEYTTGDDWPENLPVTISCKKSDLTV